MSRKAIILSFSALSLSVVFAFLPTTPLSAQETSEARVRLSIQDCFDWAAAHSVPLKTANMDVMSAKMKKEEVLAKYFPQVSASAFGYYSLKPMLDWDIREIIGASEPTRLSALQYGYTASVSAVQPLYSGGRITNGYRLAKLGIEASSLQERIKQRDLMEEVERDYWTVISLYEKLKTIDGLDSLLTRIENDVEAAMLSGFATRADQMQVRLKQNELRLARMQVENGISLLKMNLLNTIGFAYNPGESAGLDSIPRLDEVVLSDTIGELLPPVHFYVSEEEVASRQAEIQLLNLQVDAGVLQKKMIMGEALPTAGVMVSGSYGALLSESTFNASVVGVVNVPITGWGATERKMKGQEYQIDKARYEREFYSEQILLQIRQLWLNLKTSWNRLQVAEESVRTAEEATRQLQDHYKAGLCTLSELLTVQSELRHTADAYVDSKIDYYTALRSYLRRVEY